MSARRDGPVWIDLANSPHVLFFQPVIAELERRGVSTLVTARDFAQTIPLCELHGLTFVPVGEHGGAGIPGKVSSLYRRAMDLRSAVRESRPSVAVSHNSYTQIVAARTMGIPVLTTMDYEHQPANHLAFRLATEVALPEALPDAVVRRQGADARKTWRYRGIKEDVSLAGFVPKSGYLSGLGFDDERVIAVVRPPADMALYHRFENTLFGAVLDRLREQDAQVILLPRTPQQAEALAKQGQGDMLWNGPVLDGRELVAACDLVVSAGGTMNREAAALGVPAYSVYAGEPSAVDAWLAQDGRLAFVLTPGDIAKIAVVKKPADTRGSRPDGDLVSEFVDRILALAAGERVAP